MTDTIDGRKVPTKNSDVLAHSEADIIMLARAGVEGAYVLNDSSALVWELIDGVMTVEELCRLLENAFSESAPQVRSDVLSVLNSFVAGELITLR